MTPASQRYKGGENCSQHILEPLKITGVFSTQQHHQGAGDDVGTFQDQKQVQWEDCTTGNGDSEELKQRNYV